MVLFIYLHDFKIDDKLDHLTSFQEHVQTSEFNVEEIINSQVLQKDSVC